MSIDVLNISTTSIHSVLRKIAKNPFLQFKVTSKWASATVLPAKCNKMLAFKYVDIF